MARRSAEASSAREAMMPDHDRRSDPHRRLVLALSMATALVRLGALTAMCVARRAESGPVYTVALLRTHLAQHPDAWTNRPLRVRAIATWCGDWYGLEYESPCLDPQPVLSDPIGDAEPLPLARGDAWPPVAFLRRVPLLDAMVGLAPQPVHWGRLATYSIRLHAYRCGSSGQPLCYEALLLDTGSLSPFGSQAMM